MTYINLYWARGNGEPFGDDSTMFANVVSKLSDVIFNVVEVPYNAFVQTGYDKPRNSFNEWMKHNHEKGKPWIGGGYSLGATVMGDYVKANPANCVGAALLSDGLRHRDQYMDHRKPKGWGIAGERFITGNFPVWSATAPNDPISELPGDNGLRNLAPFLGFAKQPRAGRDWDALYSLQWLGYYFPGTRHTCYATEKIPGGFPWTYTSRLAELVNDHGQSLYVRNLV